MKNAEYGLTENLKFKEAVAFLKKKKTLTADEYKLLDEESRAKAFTVSGYTSMEVPQTFLNQLSDACQQ